MAAKPLKGYKRLPGSARRYLTPSGKEISEYEYRSRQARRIKGADGKPLYRNYSQQRRFRSSQEFLSFRFKLRSIDPSIVIDAGSEMEAAMIEATADPRFGVRGYWQERFRGEPRNPLPGEEWVPLPTDEIRLAKLIAAMGAPDYYFWRFWYSETRTL